jgi:hypothetical protein
MGALQEAFKRLPEKVLETPLGKRVFDRLVSREQWQAQRAAERRRQREQGRR